jgi:RNA polymerase sigma factor (sigma-70 family)
MRRVSSVLTRTSTILLEGLKDLSNAAAWHEFDVRYRPLLMAVGRRLGLKDADAEDAAQETVAAFLRNYREGSYSRDRGRLRDWLAGIMSHKVRDLQRHQVREDKLLHETPPAAEGVEDDRVKAAMDEEWAKATLRQCFEEVRKEVSPQMFESFELSALELWPAGQVAQRLGISVDAVYQNKCRVLQAVRELLPQMEEIW